jgi:hypothetical protein
MEKKRYAHEPILEVAGLLYSLKACHHAPSHPSSESFPTHLDHRIINTNITSHHITIDDTLKDNVSYRGLYTKTASDD